VYRPRPASHAHFRHRHIPELICEINSSIDAAVDANGGYIRVIALFGDALTE